MTLAEIVKNARQEKGLTIAELASECAMPSSAIYRIENGIITKLMASNAYAISEVLDVPFDTLMNPQEEE